MSESSEIGFGGLAALGTIGSVCAILLRTTHQNLKTLDIMRRDAAAASERLRQELRHNDNTIFKLQGMCADYRYAIAKLEAERDALQAAIMVYRSQAKQTQQEQPTNLPRAAGEGQQTSSTPTANPAGGEPQPFSLAPDGAKEKDQTSRLQDQIKKKGPADG